jgi:hypothetical protein
MTDASFDDLPDATFISYAYGDEDGLDELFRYLPQARHVRVFAPVKVAPSEFVSTPLVEAIREAPAMLCIKSEAQRNSRWVALEREVALRAQKPVYIFDPRFGTLKRFRRRPSLISIHDVSPITEIVVAREITAWMATNRGFSIERFDPSQFDGMLDLRHSLEDYSGLFLAFVRPVSVSGVHMQYVRVSCEDEEEDSSFFRFRPKLILGCLEPPGSWIPAWWADFVIRDGIVDLTDGGTVTPWSANRLDDMMVRILWSQSHDVS